MKRRVASYVASACVAGMVLGAPGLAMAQTDAADGAVSSPSSWSEAENMVIALYGPPSTFDPIEIDPGYQVLYGPPSVFADKENPMTVTTHNKTVKESKLETGKKTFKRAIVVKKAVGQVSYAKVSKGSSKRLTVDESSGAVTVKKGTRAGTYKVKAVVTATGSFKYKYASETVAVKVRVV